MPFFQILRSQLKNKSFGISLILLKQVISLILIVFLLLSGTLLTSCTQPYMTSNADCKLQIGVFNICQ